MFSVTSDPITAPTVSIRLTSTSPTESLICATTTCASSALKFLVRIMTSFPASPSISPESWITDVSSESSRRLSRTCSTVTFCLNSNSKIVPPVKSIPQLKRKRIIDIIDATINKPEIANQIFLWEITLKFLNMVHIPLTSAKPPGIMNPISIN